jgi:hypothetical protein
MQGKGISLNYGKKQFDMTSLPFSNEESPAPA